MKRIKVRHWIAGLIKVLNKWTVILRKNTPNQAANRQMASLKRKGRLKLRPFPFKRMLVKAVIIQMRRLKLRGVLQAIRSFNIVKTWQALKAGNTQLSRSIIIPMVGLILLMVGGTGYISVSTAENNVRQLIQQRLHSEAEKLTEKVAILKLVLQDQQEFERSLRKELQRQQALLAQHGLTATELFITTDYKLVPFPGITEKMIPIPGDQLKYMFEKERGVTSLEVEDKRYTVAFSKAHEIQQVYLLIVEESEFLAPVFALRKLILATAGIAVLVAASLGFIIVRGITEPIEHILAAIKKVSTGDYTQKIALQVAKRNEMSTLVQNFNSMVDDVSGVITGIKTTTTQLNKAGSQLQDKAEQTAANAKQLSERVAVVSEGAKQAAATVESSGAEFQSMRLGISQLVDQFAAVNAISSELTQSALSGRKAIEKILESSKINVQEATEINSLMAELIKQSKQIEKVVDMIGDITGQTKLLSLNAAIEAARAGAAGRGFGVVAQEVQKLAEQSGKAANEIRQIIGNIQQRTQAAAAGTQNMVQHIQADYQNTTDAESSFAILLSGVEKSTGEIGFMAGTMQDIADKIASVEQSMTQISAISQETSGSTLEMDTASEQQILIAHETHQLAEKLQAFAIQLKDLTARLKVDHTPHSTYAAGIPNLSEREHCA